MSVYVCDACGYPSRLPDVCDNPACLANPHANHAALIAMRDAAEKRKADDKARRDRRAALKRSGFTLPF